MSTTTVTFKFRNSDTGEYVDPTSNTVRLSDDTETFGVKRQDNDDIVVEDGQLMDRESQGIYSWTFDDPERDLTYVVAYEFTYDGETHHLEFTEPGTPSAVGTKRWTRTTLHDHLIGELGSDAGAGTSGIDRLDDIIEESFGYVHDCHDWRFRQRDATVTVNDGDSSYALTTNYSDFAKLDMRTLEETSHNSSLRFTNDKAEFMNRKSRWTVSGTLQDGAPELAQIVPDTSLATFGWKIEFVPEANATYEYTIPYLCKAPSLGVTATPKWPDFMFRLWHLNAKWRAQQAMFPDREDWKSTWRHFLGQLEKATAENDETMVTSTPRLHDGYNDLAHLASAGFGIGPSVAVWTRD